MQLTVFAVLLGFATVTGMTLKEKYDWFLLDPKGM